MDREDQRFLVLGNTICVHKEHQDQTTTLVGRRLSRVCSLEVVVEEGVPGVNPVDATLLTILNKGDGLRKTAVDDDHSRRLEEDAVVLVPVVVRVGVHLRFGEVLDVPGPANAGQSSIFQEETRLALIVQQLAVDQLAHFSLVLFSVQVAIQYRHFSWFMGLRRVTLHNNSPAPRGMGTGQRISCAYETLSEGDPIRLKGTRCRILLQG